MLQKSVYRTIFILTMTLIMLPSCIITKCRYSNGLNIDLGLNRHNNKSSHIAVKKQTKAFPKMLPVADTFVYTPALSKNSPEIISLAAKDNNMTVASHKVQNSSLDRSKNTFKKTTESAPLNYISQQLIRNTKRKLGVDIDIDILLFIIEHPVLSLAIIAALLIMAYLIRFLFAVGMQLLLIILIAVAAYLVLTFLLGELYALLGYGPEVDVYKGALGLVLGLILLFGLVVLLFLLIILLGGSFI